MLPAIFLPLLLCSGLRSINSLDTPERMITSLLDQVNTFMIQNHYDNVDLEPNQKYNFFLGSLRAHRCHIGNFSSISVIGEPIVNGTNEDSTDAVFFEFTVGWTQLEMQLDYTADIFGFISSSAIATIRNTGNALKTAGLVVKISNGSCKAILSRVEVDNLGYLDLSLKPSSIQNWILNRLANFGLHTVQRYMDNILKHRLQNLLDLYVNNLKLGELQVPCIDFSAI